jgi:hypothetical protein
MSNLSELLGKIISKEPKKVYDKKSPFYGNSYYKLKVLTEDEEKHAFFVYENIVKPALFRAIAQSHYVDKRYLLAGKKVKKGFILHYWQELSPREVDHA